MRRNKVAFVASIAALTGVAGMCDPLVAPEVDGTIKACVKQDGTLRVVDNSRPCDSSEKPLNWNQVGPAGASGVAGPSGASVTPYILESTFSNVVANVDEPSTLISVPSGNYRAELLMQADELGSPPVHEWAFDSVNCGLQNGAGESFFVKATRSMLLEGPDGHYGVNLISVPAGTQVYLLCRYPEVSSGSGYAADITYRVILTPIAGSQTLSPA